MNKGVLSFLTSTTYEPYYKLQNEHSSEYFIAMNYEIFTFTQKIMRRKVFITGATSGIGEATARLLAQHNFDLILAGRRSDRLEKLSHELTKKNQCNIACLAFDIRNKNEVDKAFSSLNDEWKNIDILINNAGLSVGFEHIHEGNTDDWDRMIDTNIKGLLYVTKLVTPQMVGRKSGHIINISSIAGKDAYERGNVYCGTKYAVEGITRGMRIDLVKHNVKVTSLSPGAAETEFSEVRFHGDKERAKKVYEGFKPLTAVDIAETILFVVTRPPHVNIDDILIMSTAQATASIIHRSSTM